MIQVALCIATEHDPWLVLVAVIICAGGAFTIVQLFERALRTLHVERLGWAFLTAVAAGTTIWCTHFVAMLAFEPAVPVTLDPVLTIASLMVAIVGTLAAFSIAAWGNTRLWAALGGALFGAAVSAMHYTGMIAYRIDGIVSWDWGFVAVSVLLAVTLSAAALVILCSAAETNIRKSLGTILIVLGIATLHFVGMTALKIAPLAISDTPLGTESWRALALATALVGTVVIGAGVFAGLIDSRTRSDAMQRLHYLAMNDALTGLPNRASFQHSLAHHIAAAQTEGSQVGVIAVDLDRFKEINDLHGHKTGDALLQALARRMEALLEGEDIVARLGGDEFVALTRFADRSNLVAFINRLETALKAPVALGDAELRVGASIGVAVYPHDARDADTLCNNADLSMYRAKCDGAASACFYDARLDEAIRDRREMAADLRLAIAADALEVHYQVQEHVATRAVTGYEALLRWNHPERGAIPPTVFVAVAEEHGLILSLGEWVLRKACAEAASWDNGSKVAVNVSALQLAHAELPRLIHEILMETGLPPKRLEIELTESAIMMDRDRALHVLRQIKALGIGVALDDFGTGYSSLETLRAFPFDKIKLDRLFASEIVESAQATAIIRAVLALGKSLSIPVLAEGIETHEQLAVLLREGCDEAQGYLLGYPEPPRQAEPGRAAA
ncbi:putative bifunctional diguanylate cyclase/phosphodiesterase [Allosphingosinicella indica]|uniref:Diguanylate cyclase/phosphodiesterase n=1 Tax=Allosphingosinicella indica TaxID=941907 RepID=A0A1X7G5D1_9SPHN|nr:bifunctional diguanylate cyclase/phosphodiesterase [Allosphingosinicella indica]SMF64265.1 diguanylate cyclase/phosphodiesterase [Allosphingosinicella indica]